MNVRLALPTLVLACGCVSSQPTIRLTEDVDVYAGGELFTSVRSDFAQ